MPMARIDANQRLSLGVEPHCIDIGFLEDSFTGVPQEVLPTHRLRTHTPEVTACATCNLTGPILVEVPWKVHVSPVISML